MSREIVNIRSSLSPFCTITEKFHYPESVKMALVELVIEYNKSFGPLVKKNREWPEDYQYIGGSANPCNFAVRVDMVGLDEKFLSIAAAMDGEVVREELRRKICEVENSFAMYQLLERLFPQQGGESSFQKGWRQALDDLRMRHQKKIALLAVTEQKYRAMMASEFGRETCEKLPDSEIFELSGFDKFFSPEEFRAHLYHHGGCEYLLYVRSSDPVAKLKNPTVKVEHPLLSDPKIRRVIKRNAITFNIDNPNWPTGDQRLINDTKWYMPPLRMAFPVIHDLDLNSQGFEDYLTSFGIHPEDVRQGRRELRFKPAQGTYGCYGHLRGPLTKGGLLKELRREISRRGPYMVQPEFEMPTIDIDGETYTYIDRVFLAYINSAPSFIGGFRSLMPAWSPEAKAGRNHGSKYTVWAEIV